eukprot:g35963.t1
MDRLCLVKEAPKAEYEVLLLQFVGGIIVTLEEAQDGHVAQGVGEGVEVVRDWKVLSFVANRPQLLYKVVSMSPLHLTDVEEATSGAADAIDHISGCAGEPLSDVKGFFGSLDGGEDRSEAIMLGCLVIRAWYVCGRILSDIMLVQAGRAQVLCKFVTESTFGHTDVEEATSGAADTVDQVDGYTAEPVSDVKGLFWALNGGEGG